jgi:hypothetical protein
MNLVGLFPVSDEFKAKWNHNRLALNTNAEVNLPILR